MPLKTKLVLAFNNSPDISHCMTSDRRHAITEIKCQRIMTHWNIHAERTQGGTDSCKHGMCTRGEKRPFESWQIKKKLTQNFTKNIYGAHTKAVSFYLGQYRHLLIRSYTYSSFEIVSTFWSVSGFKTLHFKCHHTFLKTDAEVKSRFKITETNNTSEVLYRRRVIQKTPLGRYTNSPAITKNTPLKQTKNIFIQVISSHHLFLR
jgi:hypothetical protein